MTITENTPIILLHGLGATRYTHTYIGKYKNIHNINYQVDNIHFEEVIRINS
jgi:hypothetical protein